MKINLAVHLKNDDSDSKKNDKPNWHNERRRHHVNSDDADAAVKYRQNDAPIKEETKFMSLLESAAKPQKLKQNSEDAGQEQESDDSKENGRTTREGDQREENSTGVERVERNVFSGGFGGGGGNSGGFGESGVGQMLQLSENFAARSILHIADIERIISVIRKQTALGGKREIELELKRSVLEGLKIKITTDPAAQVGIEFLAANEKIRSKIEQHSAELAEILRGRGINLQSLRTTLDYESQTDEKALADDGKKLFDAGGAPKNETSDAASGGNTFENET